MFLSLSLSLFLTSSLLPLSLLLVNIPSKYSPLLFFLEERKGNINSLCSRPIRALSSPGAKA